MEFNVFSIGDDGERHRRRAFLRTGAKSQTVSICNARNIRGDYQHIVRVIKATNFIRDDEVPTNSTIVELLDWLKTEKHGHVEKEPLSEAPESVPYERVPLSAADEVWVAQAIPIVEQALDQLVFEFLRAPYLHRVEHSLHARLFSILFAQDGARSFL